MESDCLKHQNGDQKVEVSPGQLRQGLMDDRALKEVGLLAALGAECG